MANTFLDRMENIRRSNFMAGQVQSASAYLMSRQLEGVNKVVANINEELNALNTGLDAPEDKIAAIQGSTDIQDIIPDVEKAAKTYNVILEDAQKKNAAYNEIYSKALMGLAGIGGQTAEDVSSMLSEQLGMKKEEIEAEIKAPLMELEYNKAVQSVAISSLELDDLFADKRVREDVTAASDYILHKASTFKDIPVGRLDTFSDDEIAEYNLKVSQLVDEVFKDLDGVVSRENILKAYKLAVDNSGRAGIYKAVTRANSKGLGYTEIQRRSALSAAQRLWQEYENVDPDVMQAAMEFSQGRDIIPFVAKALAKTQQDIDAERGSTDLQPIDIIAGGIEPTQSQVSSYQRQLENIISKFGPSGEYWDYYGTLMAIDPGGTAVLTPGGDPVNMKAYGGIGKPNGFNGLLEGNMIYVPTIERHAELTERGIRARNAYQEFLEIRYPRVSPTEDIDPFSYFGRAYAGTYRH